MKTWKIGILGLAYRSHAMNYMQYLSKMANVELAGMSDRNSDNAKPFQQKYDIPFFTDYRQLLDMEIDAVLICSENVFHAEMTIAAARAGKHILCEKPLGVTVPEMREMVDEAKKHRIKLMTMLPSRFSSTAWKAKKAIEAGQIGELIALKGTNRGKPPGGWYLIKELSGGGAIIDHTVHIAGIMNYLTGSKAKEVYAEGGTLFGEKEVDDAGIIHVTFENGAIATLDPSWSRGKSYPYDIDFTMNIVGTEGVITLDNYNMKNEFYSDETMLTNWNYFGDHNPEYLIRDFVKSLQNNTEVFVTGEDGLYASMVALAAYRSIERGEPVSVQSLF